jgi:hypothetical protein
MDFDLLLIPQHPTSNWEPICKIVKFQKDSAQESPPVKHFADNQSFTIIHCVTPD